MINNIKYNITNNNTYLILFIVFLIGFIMFLIGFTYYYAVIMLMKIKRFHLLNYENGYKVIRNKKTKLIMLLIIYPILMILM